MRRVAELGDATTLTKLRRFIWQFIIIVPVALRVQAQTPLGFFTNEANALLQAEFGFGVTNIPVYSTTNPAIGYSSSIHYALQSAANDYDATTPATNLPSVFRPTFAWQSNTLFITGYTCVTNDFYAQTAQGFKSLTNLTITTNDNVWGIPWVVGAKGQVPAFNEYCYSSQFYVARQLEFVRGLNANGQYNTNRPPQFTNQFYLMSISNAFGAEAWNFYSTPLPNGVTIVVSNHTTITMTNNYGFGTNLFFNSGTNISIESWPAGQPFRSPNPPGFEIPLFTNTSLLPYSYWSESTQRFLSISNGQIYFPPGDTNQRGWPVHDWRLEITNDFIYALLDNGTGRVLDFVNLGSFGSSLDLNEVLTNISETPNVWIVAPATDEPNSPMSAGAINQINLGLTESESFECSLLGLPGGVPGGTFSDPYVATAYFAQSCSWQAANPMVHYTLEDLTNPRFNQGIYYESLLGASAPITLDNSICTLGEINPDYEAGTVEGGFISTSDGLFQIDFAGVADLPYAVWASADLLDWGQIGTALQPSPGLFQFEDTQATNHPARFYQVRIP